MDDIVIFGILRGALFALAAFGFSLVLGVVGIVNFAHGVLVVFGGLLTHHLVAQVGLPYLLGLGLAAAAAGLLAGVMQRVFIAKTFRLHPLMVLVQTFGIAIVITELGIRYWGTEERLLRVDTGLPPVIEIGGKFIPSFDLVVFLVGLVSAGVLFAILNHTQFGRAVRACRDNRDSAQLCGIDIGRTFELTMVVAGVWAGLAGGLFISLSPMAPYMHFHWTVDAFLVVILGGLGSMVGALLGGLFYGVLNFAAYYHLPTLAPAVIFAVLIVLLLVRPQGLFGFGAAVRK